MTRTGTRGTRNTDYASDDADQLTKEITAGVTRTYGYDAEGNQTTVGGDTFTHNLDHTLASATVAGRRRCSYDAAALRVSTTTGADARTWSWDVSTSLPTLALETGPGCHRGFVPAPSHGTLATFTGAVHGYVPDWLGGVGRGVPVGGWSPGSAWAPCRRSDRAASCRAHRPVC